MCVNIILIEKQQQKFTAEASPAFLVTSYSSFLLLLSMGSLSHQMPFMLSISLTPALAMQSPWPLGCRAPAGPDRAGHSFSDTMKQMENPAPTRGNGQVGELRKFTNLGAGRMVS